MRKLQFYIMVLGIGLFLMACSTDIDLTADYKDITVVYGLLEPTRDTQFIKINKAFLPQDKSVEDLAGQYDPHYYKNIETTLEEYASNDAEEPTRVIPLNTIIKNNKKEGIFSHPRQKLYYTTAQLKKESIYKLVINKSDTTPPVTATTPVIDNFNVYRPDTTNFVGVDVGIDFTNLYELNWDPVGDGASYQVIVRFVYAKEDKDGKVTRDSLDWVLFNRRTEDDLSCSNQRLCYQIKENRFFEFVKSRKEEAFSDPNIKNYYPCFLRFYFYVAGETLNDYIEVARVQGSGLSQTQATPDYTNVKNGRGIFSTRYTKLVDSIQFRQITRDTLAHGPITGDIGFQPCPCNDLNCN